MSRGLDLRGRAMCEVSHGTSAKRMTNVRAVLRCAPQGGRSASDTSVSGVCDVCGEVRELSFAQWVGRIGRLSCFFAPRAECLICLCFSAARPPRTSRLLSCHRSVGALLLAVLARRFAKLRSDKIRTKRLGRGVAAESLQSMWCVLGGRRCVACRQVDRGEARERQLQCLCFADRAQEDDKQMDLGRT